MTEALTKPSFGDINTANESSIRMRTGDMRSHIAAQTHQIEFSVKLRDLYVAEHDRLLAMLESREASSSTVGTKGATVPVTTSSPVTPADATTVEAMDAEATVTDEAAVTVETSIFE